MNVKLYSIPWICERENFAASSDTARKDFLRQYFIEEFNNPSKIFSPPDELKIEDLGTLFYSTTITYAAIKDGRSSFTWYLFITEIRRTTNNIIKFDYRIDYFQTFFEFNLNTKLRGNIIQTTGTSFPTYAKYLPVEPKECILKTIKKYNPESDELYFTVLNYKCETKTRSVILNSALIVSGTKFKMGYKEAVYTLNKCAFATKFKLTSESGEVVSTENCEIKNAFVFPAYFINRLPNSGLTNCILENNSGETKGIITVDDTFIDTLVINDFLGDYKQSNYVIKYGTANFQNILPVARYDNFDIKILINKTENDIIINALFADEIIDITSDFSFETIYSQSAKYVQDGVLIDSIAIAGKAISTLTGASTSLATGNIADATLGISGGIVGITGGLQSIDNKLHSPVEIRGSGNGAVNLPLTGGFAFFIYEPVNAPEIANEINKHGYYVNVYMEMPAEQLLSFNEFFYIRYSDIIITGYMPLEARERVQNIFLNGLYLHNAG